MYGQVLIHYGIPKQQWGVRRYENYDGTLTEAGKERYYKRRTTEDAADLDDHNLTPEGVMRDSYKMDDKQLNAAYNRLNTQRNIQAMIPKTKEEKIRLWVTATAATVATALVTAEIKGWADDPDKQAEKWAKRGQYIMSLGRKIAAKKIENV